MKKKILWAVVVLLMLAAAWRLSWPRFLPVERMHGDPELPGSFEELVNRAELIVLADIKSVKQGPDYLAPIGTDSVYREPTQRVSLEVVKVYKGDVAGSNMLTLFQGSVGVTWSIQDHPWPVFRINESDPVYKRGERYILMLRTVPISEEVKPYQPDPWQEGMLSVLSPGRMRLNADGTVTSVLDTFGTNGKTLAEIEEMIATSPIFSLDDLERARESLFSYLSLLHAGRYAEAVNLYGGSYDILRDWNPAVDPNDYAALFASGCETNGLMCLDVAGVLLNQAASSHEFKFNVEFINEDGSLFVFGPEASPQSQFIFTVSKDEDGKFLVQDLPVYAP
jgi:hypothetical protein